jgi:hypothetical protein
MALHSFTHAFHADILGKRAAFVPKRQTVKSNFFRIPHLQISASQADDTPQPSLNSQPQFLSTAAVRPLRLRPLWQQFLPLSFILS